MADSEDFIQKFHSIEGVTLKERKRSFYSLLNSLNPSDSHTLDAIIQKLTPSTYLEECYKIELLIHFKRTRDLLEVLMEGGEIRACKIARQDWFIQELLNLYSPIQFIEEVVPKISYSVRMKMFKTIFNNVRNEGVLEDFFDGILKLYGIKNALIFLPGCSDKKIEQEFTHHPIHFSASQLKLLFHKNNDLITKYFDILKKNSRDIDDYKWRSFFSYIGKQNPLFYFEICEKFNIDKLRLGKQSTKKFVNAKKDQIICKPYEYTRVLRKDVLVRKLGVDFPVFYKNLLPENVTEFRFFSPKSIIKYYPKHRQYNLYFNTFTEVYNISLWDNTEYMDQKLIEYISNKDDREKWVLKFEDRQNIKKYLKRKKCAMFFIEDKNVPVIKDKKTIFNKLISTCKLTKDYDAFINILKSFCDRHRNSDVTIIYNFLRTIYRELDLLKFKDEHWKYIYDIISIQLFKKQQIFHPIFVEYIKFQYLEKRPIEEFVLILLNEAPLDLSKFDYNNKDFEKNLHLTFVKLIPNITNRKNEIVIQIALSLIRWNKKYPVDHIFFSNQEDITEAIMELCDSEKHKKDLIKILKYLICSQDGNENRSSLDDVYWSNYKKFEDVTITKWYIKYKPMVLKNHIKKIGLVLKNKNKNFINNLKKYNHLDIPKDISTICLEDIKISEAHKCDRIIKILIPFMEKSALEQYMLEYVPEDDKIGTIGENYKKTHFIQCALSKNLKVSEDINALIPILLKYCKGNILRSALSSLYSSFYRMPQNRLKAVMEELDKGSVSVKKHTIFLTSLILPVEDVLSKYNEIQLTESRFSVKQHMFTSCLKYFMRNESSECWPIIKTYLGQLQRKQKDVLKMITEVHLFPMMYRAEYTEIVWKILEKYKKETELIDDNMYALLYNLKTDDIIRLDVQFCCEIIENNLYDSEECSFTNSVSDFCRKFLMYGQRDERKIKALFTVIQRLREKTVNDPEKHKKSLDILNRFCFRLLSDILSVNDIDKIDAVFPKKFKDALRNVFSIEEVFEENMFLDLILFKIVCSDFKESLGKHTNKMFSSAIQEHGHLVLKRFERCLQNVLSNLYPNDELSQLQFLNSFLAENSSLDHCALVIGFIPYISKRPEKKLKVAYDELLKILNAKGQIMKIILYGKLKNM